MASSCYQDPSRSCRHWGPNVKIFLIGRQPYKVISGGRCTHLSILRDTKAVLELDCRLIPKNRVPSPLQPLLQICMPIACKRHQAQADWAGAHCLSATPGLDGRLHLCGLCLLNEQWSRVEEKGAVRGWYTGPAKLVRIATPPTVVQGLMEPAQKPPSCQQLAETA